MQQQINNTNCYNCEVSNKLRLKRFFNRVIFIILELLSLPLTYLMCIIFKVLMKIEGSIIGDYNLVFLALWLFVVYKIYSKFKYKIK